MCGAILPDYGISPHKYRKKHIFYGVYNKCRDKKRAYWLHVVKCIYNTQILLQGEIIMLYFHYTEKLIKFARGNCKKCSSRPFFHYHLHWNATQISYWILDAQNNDIPESLSCSDTLINCQKDILKFVWCSIYKQIHRRL